MIKLSPRVKRAGVLFLAIWSGLFAVWMIGTRGVPTYHDSTLVWLLEEALFTATISLPSWFLAIGALEVLDR